MCAATLPHENYGRPFLAYPDARTGLSEARGEAHHKPRPDHRPMITPRRRNWRPIRNHHTEQLDMITRDEIAKLPPKGRTQLFDDLAGALFPTQEACATALEVGRKTLHNWRKDDNVPLMALLALHSMAEAKLGAELVEVAAHLGRAVDILERLATPVQPAPAGSAGKTSSAARATGASAR